MITIKAALIMTIKAALPHHRQNLWRRIRSSLPLGRVEPSIKPGQVIFRNDLEGKFMDNSHWHLQTLWEARTNYLFSY